MLELLETESNTAADLYGDMPYDNSVQPLAERLTLHIESLVPRGRARCLEVGAGDAPIAGAIHERLARTDWRCCAVPASSAVWHAPRCSEHRTFDGDTIPYDDGEFDVAMLSGVLHDAPEHAPRLLAEAARVARYVVVTDHLERESDSRTSPRLTPEAFIRLANQQQLVITGFDSAIAPRARTPGAKPLAPTNPNFVAVLHRSPQ